MTSDLLKLTRAVEEAFKENTLKIDLEKKISSERDKMGSALKTQGEYIFTDEQGRSYRITTVNSAQEEDDE